MSISRCDSLPSKGWETTQQDVGDDSSCPDVHLKAISAQTQRNMMIFKQPIYSFVPFINSKLQEEDFCSITCSLTASWHDSHTGSRPVCHSFLTSTLQTMLLPCFCNDFRCYICRGPADCVEGSVHHSR